MAWDVMGKGESPGRASTEVGTSKCARRRRRVRHRKRCRTSLAAIGVGPVVVAAVGAPAVVGSALVVGAGEFAHQAMHEDWSQDRDDHGVIGGLGDAIADLGNRWGLRQRDQGVSHSVFG
jgi:hypothetical protein